MMTGLATKTEPLANRAGSAGDVSAFARPVETNVVQNDTCNLVLAARMTLGDPVVETNVVQNDTCNAAASRSASRSMSSKRTLCRTIPATPQGTRPTTARLRVETNVVQNDTCNAFSQSHRNERCAERYLQRRAV